MSARDASFKSRLQPLARRKVSPTTPKRFAEAVDYLNSIAGALEAVPELVELAKKAREARSTESRTSYDAAIALGQFASALFAAQLMSSQQFAFMISSVAESVLDRHFLAGDYPEMTKILDEMSAVESANGLKDDEYWPVGEGRRVHRTLDKQFDAAWDVRFAEALRELGAQSIAALFLSDRQAFDRTVERGRRSIHQKSNLSAAVKDTVIRYEHEARKAASAGAYTGAVVLLGAAIEGVLLLRCLRSPTKARLCAAKLPRERRPKKLDNLSKWTFDTLIETCIAAGWLPELVSLAIPPSSLAHKLREMRNFVHPGKVGVERPWIAVDELDYEKAEAIYTALNAALGGGVSVEL
jgi:hypothetical protein